MDQFKALEESRKRPLYTIGDKSYLALAYCTDGYFAAIELNKATEGRIEYARFVVIDPNSRKNPISDEFAKSLDPAKFSPDTAPNAASLDDIVQLVATRLRHDSELGTLSSEARAESLRTNPWPLQLYTAQVLQEAREAQVFRDDLPFEHLLCALSDRYIHTAADYCQGETLESWVVRLVAKSLA